MAGDLLGVSVSGLNLSQTALRTAGHNIANANTEGYTRQSVLSSANPSLYTGAGFLGNGVEVTNITRQANEFVVNQLRTDTALFNQQQTYLDSAEQLDNLLANPSLGLADALQRFFTSLQAGADDPTSIASRQLIISEGQSLVDRFNTLHDRLTTIENNVVQQMNIAVSSANGLLGSIANLNASIARSSGGTNGDPNDLLDRRDQALLELSEIVGVQVTHLNDGQVNVSLAGGQSLILGDRVNKFELIDSPHRLGQKDLAVIVNSQSNVVTDQVVGGKLSGYIDYRDNMLNTAFNNIGRISIALAGTMNSLHEQGVDLNGEFGKRMFFEVNDDEATNLRVLHGPENKPPYNRELSLQIVDVTHLTGSNYRVNIEEGSQRFSIVREIDGVEVVSNLLTGRTPQNVEFDGLKMTFEGGSFQQGDRFYLQPTRDAAREMSFDILDPEALAFSKPIIAESVIGNLGNGAISLGDLVSLSNVSSGELPLFEIPGQMSPPLMVRFTSPSRYDILDNTDPSLPVQLDPPIRNQLFIPNQDNVLFGTSLGETMIVADGSRLGISSLNNQSPILNGYPAERFVFNVANTEGVSTEYQVVTPPDASMDQLAVLLGNVPGVSINAWTEVNLNNMTFDGAALPSFTINGQELIETELDELGATVIGANIPDPVAEPSNFMDYLAVRINDQFIGEGITADVKTVDGNLVLNVVDVNGRDIQVGVQNARLDLNDGVTDNDNNGELDTVTLGELTDPETRTIGGRFNMTLAEGVTVETIPTPSKLMGDTEPKETFLGIQAILSGNPKSGDGFTLQWNKDAYGDNRNALSLVNVELMGLINGGKMTVGDAYGVIIEDVGIKTSSAKINAQASEGVMQQSQTLRNSISAVNLDEEAANLIKFEQMYSANAQAISVARTIFDRLLNSF